jgi:Family of unknown function (DUF6879)
MALLTGADLRQLFTTFEHTAFRLEVRESYYEREQLGQFLAGGPVDLSDMDGWLGLIVKARVAGKRITRVRVVSTPHSDYTRFGLWLCAYNTRAGEDIRYLDREAATDLPDHDYWLFDSSRLYRMHFTDTDELLGAELVEDAAAVVEHNRWRDVAWHQAVPYPEYMKADAGAVEHPTGA